MRITVLGAENPFTCYMYAQAIFINWICIIGFILPGHIESKLLISKQPGDQMALSPFRGTRQ